MVRNSWESSLGAERAFWAVLVCEVLAADGEQLLERLFQRHLMASATWACGVLGCGPHPCPLQTWEVKVQTCKQLEITLWNKKGREGVWTLQREVGEKEGRREGQVGWGSVLVMKPPGGKPAPWAEPAWLLLPVLLLVHTDGLAEQTASDDKRWLLSIRLCSLSHWAFGSGKVVELVLCLVLCVAEIWSDSQEGSSPRNLVSYRDFHAAESCIWRMV